MHFISYNILVAHKADGVVLVYDGEVHSGQYVWDSQGDASVKHGSSEDFDVSVVKASRDFYGEICVENSDEHDLCNTPYYIFE